MWNCSGESQKYLNQGPQCNQSETETFPAYATRWLRLWLSMCVCVCISVGEFSLCSHNLARFHVKITDLGCICNKIKSQWRVKFWPASQSQLRVFMLAKVSIFPLVWRLVKTIPVTGKSNPLWCSPEKFWCVTNSMTVVGFWVFLERRYTCLHLKIKSLISSLTIFDSSTGFMTWKNDNLVLKQCW